jgi:hypothetical protein
MSNLPFAVSPKTELCGGFSAADDATGSNLGVGVGVFVRIGVGVIVGVGVFVGEVVGVGVGLGVGVFVGVGVGGATMATFTGSDHVAVFPVWVYLPIFKS